MKKFFRPLANNWPLLIILVLAFVTRFYRLRELTTFGGDQGVDYLRVLEMIRSRRPTLLGPITHVGIYLGPLYYYLLIPLFLIFRFDPIAAPAMFALFGTATVGLVYLLTEKTMPTSKFSIFPLVPRLGGKALRAGNFQFLIPFLTALLYAVSPVILESSRAPSQPHLIPFFAALVLISAIRIIGDKDNKWDWAAIGISLAAAIQFHFLAYPLFIFVFFLIAYAYPRAREARRKLNVGAKVNSWRRRRPSAWGVRPAAARSGVVGLPMEFYFNVSKHHNKRKTITNIFSLFLPLLAGLSPWILFELRHRFFITNQIIAYLQSGEVGFSPVSYLERVLDLTWFSFDRLLGQGNQFVTTAAIIAFLSAILGIVRVRSWRASRPGLLIILAFFVMNIFGISFYLFPLSNHYISALYPVIVILTAVGIFRIFPDVLGVAALIVLIVFNLGKNDFFRDHGYTMPAEVTTRTIETAAAVVADDVKGKNITFEIANTLDGDTRAYPYRYVLTAVYRLSPAGVEHYPEADYLYIVHRGNSGWLLRDNRWELASFPAAKVDFLGKVGDDIGVTRFTAGEADRGDLLKYAY